jgi:GT2 family glycosyltransferase
MKTPAVQINILIYNGWEETVDCLESVFSQSYQNISVWVLNNGSKENKIDDLKAKFPNANYITLPQNLGFSGGHNYLLQHHNQNPDYFLFLNNDAILEHRAVETFVDFAEKTPDAGTVHPIVLYKDRSKIWCFGQKIVYPLGIVKLTHKGEPYNDSFPEVITSDITSGASLFISQKVLNEIGGGFDDSYFAYYEDTKLSLQVNNLKLKHYFLNLPDAKLFHAVSSTGGYSGKFVFSKLQAYLRGRNGLLIIKVMPIHTKLIYLLGRLLFALPFELYKCIDNKARYAMLAGMFDAITNRFNTAFIRK